MLRDTEKHQVSFTESRAWDLVFVGCGTAAILLLILWPTIDVSLGGDQYVFLVRQLAHGSLNVDNLPQGYGDYAPWNGHKYLPFGPLPAVILIPFLPLLNAGVPMVLIGYVFTILNAFLFFRILRFAGVSDERRYWATLLYFAGTPYLSIALVGISTYLAQIVATTFLLLALHAALSSRRFFLVGLFVGLAACARLTALGALPFFVWWVWSSRREEQNKRATVEIAALVGGLVIPMLLLGWYNAARFGNPLETGFGFARLYTDVLQQARAAGLFSAAHIPKNLFMMLLQGPTPSGGANSPVLRFPFFEPSPWGMGLFFTSPALLYVFRASRSTSLVQACWLAVLVTALPLITYYGIGYVQFGYRYALDFMPFLILLAAWGFRPGMTARARALVAASVAINVWGAIFLAIWI